MTDQIDAPPAGPTTVWDITDWRNGRVVKRTVTVSATLSAAGTRWGISPRGRIESVDVAGFGVWYTSEAVAWNEVEGRAHAEYHAAAKAYSAAAARYRRVRQAFAEYKMGTISRNQSEGKRDE